MRIVLPDVAVQRVDPGDADRNVGLALAPGSTERVGHDHRDVEAELAEPFTGGTGGGVAVLRQDQHPLVGTARRLVDTGVGTHESVMRLGDQHRADLTDDPPRLPEDDLDHARIFVPPRTPVGRKPGRMHVGQLDRPALGLRHDLGGDQHDVAVGEIDLLDDQAGQVGTHLDLGQTGHGQDRQRRRRGRRHPGNRTLRPVEADL